MLVILKKMHAYTQLNLACSDVVDKSKAFTFAEGEDREDPDVLLQRFAELCLPTKNIMARHIFNTTHIPGESIQLCFHTQNTCKNCDFGALSDELICDCVVCRIESDR